MRRMLSQSLLVQESQVLVSNMPTTDVGSLADEVSLAKSSDELDADIVAIDEAADVATALEEIAQLLPQADQTGLRIAQVSASHMLARVGVALEDSEEDSGKITLDVGKLGAKVIENAKKIWRAIIEALKRAWRWLKNHARQLLDFSERTKKRAEELLKKLKDPKLGERKAENFSDAGLAAKLAVEGKFPKRIDQAANRTALVLGSYLDKAYNSHLYDADFIKKLTDGRNEFTFNPTTVQFVAPGITFTTYEHGLVNPATTAKVPADLKDDCEWRGSPVLLGDHMVTQLVPKRPLEGLEAVRALVHAAPQVGLILKQGKSGAECPVATREQLISTAEAALDLATKVNDFRGALEHLEEMADKLIKAAEGQLGNDTHPNSKPTGMLAEQQKWQRIYLTAAPRWLVQEPTEMANYGLKVANALVTYVQKSLAQYEAAKAQ